MAQETTVNLCRLRCLQKRRLRELLYRFEAEGFSVRGLKMMHLSDEVLKEHYAHVADKPFFPEIVKFMQSSPVVALALSGDNVIARVRDLLGPTDSAAAPKGTIRGDFGENKMINVCHASDAPEAAEAELKRFFADSELF